MKNGNLILLTRLLFINFTTFAQSKKYTNVIIINMGDTEPYGMMGIAISNFKI